MSRGQLAQTTIRDFGGGWDLSDSDKALSSKFQTVSDNVVRGTDGHFRKRYGTKLFSKLRKGTTVNLAAAAYTVTTTNGSSVVRITHNAHGRATGDHVTISGFVGAAVNGVTADMLQKTTWGIWVVDANNYEIYIRGVATGTGGAARTFNVTFDTHVLAARDIFGRYYKNNLIVFAENGEIAAVSSAGVATRIWSYQIARGLTLEPWTYCQRVSAEIVRGRLIAVNGAANDKPLAIDGTTVNYMVDASTLSNGAIPRADFVIAASNYIVLVSTEYGATKLEIGAKNTVMTASREVSPDDAVEIDVGMLTQTVDATIYGASVIRSRVFLGFTDRSMLGTLGIYNASVHEPDFNDNIAEFGTFSHSSIISLGNDLFCPGLNGVNSLQISTQSGEYQPQTVSDLIHPAMLRHLARLTDADRQYRTFAVWDNSSRSYMLFAPKYSAGSYSTEPDPIFVTSTLQQYNLCFIRARDHVFDEGDYIDIANVVGIVGVDAAAINGRRRIRHVLDKDTLVVEVDAYAGGTNTALGGSTVTLTPVNDETIAYVYEYNPRLKIKRWTRFRDLNFDWGCRSQLNHLFFGKDGSIFQFGDTAFPFTADEIGNYDDATYASGNPYALGRRVLDTVENKVYQVAIAYTSSGLGLFSAERAAFPDNWVEYNGEEIAFALETAWSDFGTRQGNKQIELVGFDTKGTAEFDFSIFKNTHYRHLESYALDPDRTTTFVAEDTPGFGGGDQPFGGGRNTRQELLHSMPVFGKLFRLRFSGSSIHPLQVNAATLHYFKTEVTT